MSKRKFNRLRTAIDRRNANWLEHADPEISDALRAEIEDGASPEEVEDFANEVSGEQDWFGKKIKSAARHIESVLAQRG